MDYVVLELCLHKTVARNLWHLKILAWHASLASIYQAYAPWRLDSLVGARRPRLIHARTPLAQTDGLTD